GDAVLGALEVNEAVLLAMAAAKETRGDPSGVVMAGVLVDLLGELLVRPVGRELREVENGHRAPRLRVAFEGFDTHLGPGSLQSWRGSEELDRGLAGHQGDHGMSDVRSAALAGEAEASGFSAAVDRVHRGNLDVIDLLDSGADLAL